MGFYVIKVEHHWSNQDKEKFDVIQFSDDQLGERIWRKGWNELRTSILPCEGCKYEDRDTTKRPCFECRRIKPDLYESVYEKEGDSE